MQTIPARRLAAVTGIAALAFAGAAGTTAHAATTTLTYDCTALGSVNVGQWTVAMNVDLPESVTVGEALPAPAITSTVTTSDRAADLMRGTLQAESVEGTGTFAYTIDETAFTGKVTVPETLVPDSGPIVVDADGTGADAEAPEVPTTSTITAGNFDAALKVTSSTGTVYDVAVACTVAEGTDATIGTIDVVEEPTEPEPTEPEPTEPEPTEPEPTDPTEEPTDPTEEPTDPTEEPTDAPSGPPVETGVTSSGANGETIALGLMAVGGVAAVTAATRRRLND